MQSYDRVSEGQPRVLPGAPLRPDAYFLRALAAWGAAHAPEPLVRYSPPAWGLLFALGLPAMRARVLGNLRRIYGGSRSRWREQADVARTFAQFASCLTEALAMGGGEGATARDPEIAITGRGHLERALAERRGMVLVTAHTGAWEMTAPIMCKKLGIDVTVAMASEPNERARRLSDEARRRAGLRVVHVGTGDRLSVIELYSHLRSGGAVGLQIDRLPPGMRGIEVELFGERARIPSGPFELARASGAPVLPIFSRRLGYFRYEVQVAPEIRVPPKGSATDLSRAARSAALAMEAFLRENPTHWFHFADA
jgi:KDO2-lipid IV(A) lauroyltransferase